MKQFGENGTSVCLSPQGTELTEKPIAQLFHGKRDHYKCEYCGRTYMIKLYFDMHVKKHEGLLHLSLFFYYFSDISAILCIVSHCILKQLEYILGME